MSKNYSAGAALCLVAAISWGGMFPVMTSALRRIDPFTFTAMRYSIALVAFMILLLVKEGTSALSLKNERWGLAWLFGTAGFAGFGFLAFLGQQLAGPGGALTASIVMATMPLLGLLVGWVLKGIKPAAATLGFILLSFSGVVTVITKGDFASLAAPENYAAYIPLVLGALCWVIYTVGGSYFPKWSAYRYTTVTTLLGMTSVFTISAALILFGAIPLPTESAVESVIPHLIYMALAAGFIGVLSWNLGNKIITPLNGVLFMDVVPLTAFTVSAMTGVLPSNIQIYGALITGSALILNNIYQRRRLAAASTSLARV